MAVTQEQQHTLRTNLIVSLLRYICRFRNLRRNQDVLVFVATYTSFIVTLVSFSKVEEICQILLKTPHLISVAAEPSCYSSYARVRYETEFVW